MANDRNDRGDLFKDRAHRWGSASKTYTTKRQGDRVDTERAVLGDNLYISIRRLKPLAVEITGVPYPMFRLDTSPVGSSLAPHGFCGSARRAFLPRAVFRIRGWIGQASRVGISF